MVTANLIGFSYGSDGLSHIAKKFISVEGFEAVCKSFVF